jgi:hypothetical protein
MKHARLLLPALVLVCVINGLAASASQAWVCAAVETANTGNRTDSMCGTPGAGEFIKAKKVTKILGGDQYCVETFEANAGNRTDDECNTAGAGNFIRVKNPLILWQRRGEVLKAGSMAVKLMLKGTAKLSIPKILTVECKNSNSENSTIEGQGSAQGADKGSLSFTACLTNVSGCSVAEPIKTNQTKSHLAVTESPELHAVDVFEPEKGSVFTQLKLKGSSCGVLAGTIAVDGNVAAEVKSETGEEKEGSLSFPEKSIEKVLEENEKEHTLSLTVGGIVSTFSATYGTLLESGEAFGVGS